MHQYQYGRATRHGDTLNIPIIDASGQVEHFTCHIEQFVEAVIELAATYDIKPCPILNVVPEGDEGMIPENFFAAFKGLSVYYEPAEKSYAAEMRNGDTGRPEHGFGNTTLNAVGELARAHGFKSKLPDDGPLTISQWFVDFQYGFIRISDEQLQAELDGIFAPEKGAW